jgi:hypothetical protein
VVPGSCPGLIVAAAPAAHSASRLLIPKQPNAPAVASASSAGTGSRVRRAKSSRSRYGWPATTAAACAPRLRTSDRPSLIAGWSGTGHRAQPAPATPAAAARGAGRGPFKVSLVVFSRVASTALALTSTPRTSTPCLRTSLIRLAGA